MERRTRFAANTINIDGTIVRNGVVTVANALVESYAPLYEEQANTIWLGGEIVIKKHANGQLQAFHKGELLR